MAQIFILLAIFVMTVISGFSQTKAIDYSGKWSLDVSASKLIERARIESITMTVTQTVKDIKVETETKRAERPESAWQSSRGGGMGRGGDTSLTYALDRKETSVDQTSPIGTIPVKLKAKQDAGKLDLSQSRTMSGQMGEMTMTTKEEWSLSADGKTLTVARESSTPRGTNSSTMVFTKQ